MNGYAFGKYNNNNEKINNTFNGKILGLLKETCICCGSHIETVYMGEDKKSYCKECAEERGSMRLIGIFDTGFSSNDIIVD